jgi:hypothetical protein
LASEAVVVVERRNDRVLVRASSDGNEMLRADFALGQSGVTLAYRDDPTAELSMTSLLPRPLPFRPSGTARTPASELVVESTIENAMVAWRATVGTTTCDLQDLSDRNRCSELLWQSELARPLSRLLRLRSLVVARMAETSAMFEIALLARTKSPGEDPWPPQIEDADDLHPPGLLPGDTPGLGMTCSSQIKCPGSAPYCVTADHSQVFGYCNRSCVLDSDCATAAGLGRCGTAVTDIPGIDGSLRMCEVLCEDDGQCPGLLECERPGSPCMPVQ